MNITPDEIEEYCRNHTSPLPAVFQRLREATYAEAHAPQMQVGHLEGSFLALLVKLLQAKLVLEIGTFTGFSGLAMAEAMAESVKSNVGGPGYSQPEDNSIRHLLRTPPQKQRPYW